MEVRGFVDLAVNGSYWIGVMATSGLSLVFLNEKYFDAN